MNGFWRDSFFDKLYLEEKEWYKPKKMIMVAQILC